MRRVCMLGACVAALTLWPLLLTMEVHWLASVVVGISDGAERLRRRCIAAGRMTAIQSSASSLELPSCCLFYEPLVTNDHGSCIMIQPWAVCHSRIWWIVMGLLQDSCTNTVAQCSTVINVIRGYDEPAFKGPGACHNDLCARGLTAIRHTRPETVLKPLKHHTRCLTDALQVSAAYIVPLGWPPLRSGNTYTCVQLDHHGHVREQTSYSSTCCSGNLSAGSSFQQVSGSCGQQHGCRQAACRCCSAGGLSSSSCCA